MKIKFKLKTKDEFLKSIYLKNEEISTQKDLAKKLDIHEKTLSRILNGKAYISMKLAKELIKLSKFENFNDIFDNL